MHMPQRSFCVHGQTLGKEETSRMPVKAPTAKAGLYRSLTCTRMLIKSDVHRNLNFSFRHSPAIALEYLLASYLAGGNAARAHAPECTSCAFPCPASARRHFLPCMLRLAPMRLAEHTCDSVQDMEGSPTKLAARRHARADIESAVRDANCADSCSSLDGYGKPLRSGSSSDDGGGSPGVLDWNSDTSEPAGEEPDPSPPKTLFNHCRCSGGASVAMICLLLTLGSFVVPKSSEHVGALVKHVQHLSSRAKVISERAREDASFHRSALIAKMQGKRHCRAPPRVLHDGTIQRVRLSLCVLLQRLRQPAV